MNTSPSNVVSLPAPTIDLKLTRVESDELFQLLDVATKAAGLQAAGPALKYVGRLQAAWSIQPQPSTAPIPAKA